MIKLHHGDCLEIMKDLPTNSVDMVLCDLPYGTTQNKWDTIIPFESLWFNYTRVLKPNSAVVLTASQPFTSALVMSKPEWFKYEWIWRKNNATGHLNAKRMPMKSHENVLVFSNGKAPYFPQGTVPFNKKVRRGHNGGNFGESGRENFQEVTNYPRSVVDVSTDSDKNHPTQKPVALMEYFIKTYTNEGGTVLDNTMGSGTTGVACADLGRNFIGIEMDEKYFEIAKNRIEDAAERKMIDG